MLQEDFQMILNEGQLTPFSKCKWTRLRHHRGEAISGGWEQSESRLKALVTHVPPSQAEFEVWSLCFSSHCSDRTQGGREQMFLSAKSTAFIFSVSSVFIFHTTLFSNDHDFFYGDSSPVTVLDFLKNISCIAVGPFTVNRSQVNVLIGFH